MTATDDNDIDDNTGVNDAGFHVFYCKYTMYLAQAYPSPPPLGVMDLNVLYLV